MDRADSGLTGPDNQRKARRLKQKRDQTTAQAQSNSTGSDLKINLNLVLTGLIEFLTRMKSINHDANFERK